LAHDLRWTWRADIRALFERVDPDAWRRVRGNPVRLFREVSAERLWRAAEDPDLQGHVLGMVARLAEEDRAEPKDAAARELVARGERIAYFSAEFGLTEILPIYAGGLGILAGDLLKSASDLGVPMTGVGLFYREGYFRQVLSDEGRQTEAYPVLEPDELPLSIAETPDGSAPVVSVNLAGRNVNLLIRMAKVGRVPVLLLDSNLPENEAPDREVTARLYGGGHEMRLQQEIVLGIGGSRALEKLQLWPTIRHINEGHAAFVSLEKIRRLVQEENLTFAEAREAATSGNVFTTHTPVPAGIDVFTPELLWKYFAGYVNELGISFDEFFDLGREVGEEGRELFSMAVLAMRLSTHQNAVSKLHADVSRRLWRNVAPDLPLSEIPLGTTVHNIELKIGKGGQLARTAGSSAQVVAKEGEYVTLRLRSTEMRLVHGRCLATIGEVGNSEHELLSVGKAGKSRWLGKRPKVRGVAMNPVDHPLGGGEGKSSGGRPPTSPWGKPEGRKTRHRKKQSTKLIVRGRKRGKATQ